MPFITQGKTNVKYLGIVAVCAVLAGTGIFLYQQYFDKKSAEIFTQSQQQEQQKALERNQGRGEVVESPSGTVDDATWKTYRNDEINLEFRYPEDYKVSEGKEMKGFDSGQMRTITIQNLDQNFSVTIQATSPDYSQGVGEGCCFSYAGKKIDLTLTDNELQKEINSQLGKGGGSILKMQRQPIGGKASVRFFRINSYSEQCVEETILIPLDGPVFTNILISSPNLVFFDIDKPYDEIAEYINTYQFLNDQNIKDNYSIFNQILSTFSFSD